MCSALASRGYTGATLWIRLASATPDEMRSFRGPVTLSASRSGVELSDLVSISTEGSIKNQKRNAIHELTATDLPSTTVGWYFHFLTASRAAAPRFEEQFTQSTNFAVCTSPLSSTTTSTRTSP